MLKFALVVTLHWPMFNIFIPIELFECMPVTSMEHCTSSPSAILYKR